MDNNERFILPTEKATYDQVLLFREYMYNYLSLMDSGGHHIDLDLVRSNEKSSLYILVMGSKIAHHLYDKDIPFPKKDEHYEKYFDVVQDSLPEDVKAFSDSHYDAAKIIFVTGMVLFNSTLPVEEKEGAERNPAFEILDKIMEQKKIEQDTEHKQMEACIETFYKDKEEYDYIKAHLPSAYVIMEKGMTCWKHDIEDKCDEMFRDETEIRNLFFKGIMFDEFMQKNEIIDHDREMAYNLFLIGAFLEKILEKDNDKQK